MTFMKRRTFALFAVALTAGSLVGTATASADNFFDRLFGNGNRMNRSRVDRASEERPPSPRVKAPKISSPSYYTYRPESLVHVDVQDVASAARSVPLPVIAGQPVFSDAMAEIGDYELFAESDIARAIVKHYSADPQFIWVSGYGPNARARKALQVLAEAGSYGLSEADYTVPRIAPDFSREGAASRLRALARFEMALSARVLRYVRDASVGRVDPNKLSGYHDLPRKPFHAARILASLEGADDIRTYLLSRHPQNAKYNALRAELASLRVSAAKDIVVDPDTFVKPGGSSEGFAKLLKIIARDADSAFLEKYGDLLASHAGSTVYSRELVPVIKAAQKAHDLNTDGIVGPRTVGAIAGPSKMMKIGKVLMSLERLRWLPSDLGDPRVVINASSFTATYTQNGRDVDTMRVVVGKRANQTSFFYDRIEYVEFNPFWGVPRSILVNEMLPKLLRDPGYLDRAGYEVTDSRGRRISSAAVDWGRYGGDIPFDVRQLPGKSNALGELKIMFPNKHAIYMHDTPNKSLFERDTRAFSHGCVRLQKPREMAAAVLNWPVRRVAGRVAEGHSKADVNRDIPVYVGYFTAWPDDMGKVSYSGDVYGRDKHLKKALDKVEDVRAPSS